MVNLRTLKLFALYTCKQNAKKAVQSKVEYIAKQSRNKKRPVLQADLFVKTLKSILKLASIDFTKAVIETGYMDGFYKEEDYTKLDSAIDTIC